MINLTSAQMAIVKDDESIKAFRVHFPNGERADLSNSDIVFESVKFKESVCSDQSFRFGSADASCIEFETVGVGNIIGLTIECSMTFTLGNQSVTVPYGTFIVDSCPRDHASMVHRKVTAYSSTRADMPCFLQSAVLPMETVTVNVDAIKAYVTNDTTGLTEKNLTSAGAQSFHLCDANGINYRFFAYDAGGNNVTESKIIGDSDVNLYRLKWSETGTMSNDDVGMEVVQYLDSNNLDLTYNPDGKKIFDSNEEALRFVKGFLFRPSVYMLGSTNIGGVSYSTDYRPYPAVLNRVCPSISNYDLRQTLWMLNSCTKIRIEKSSSADIWSSVTWSTVAEVPVSFSVTSEVKGYHLPVNKLSEIVVKSTMDIEDAVSHCGKSTSGNKSKWYTATMHSFSNAYSNMGVLGGWAELNAGFLRTNRDGTVSLIRLDNSSPYALNSGDVEGSAWWDEYVIKPIGTVTYSAENADGQEETYTYIFSGDPSVYDLTSNEVLKAMDFTIEEVSTASAMTDVHKFYYYTGTEAGYVQNSFYYRDENQYSLWISGGAYSDVTSLINALLKMFFIPYVHTVDFVPLEATFRGMPYLQCGDAITLTAADGTVINSYILNQSCDGIQHISQDVETVQGIVIGSEIVY